MIDDRARGFLMFHGSDFLFSTAVLSAYCDCGAVLGMGRAMQTRAAFWQLWTLQGREWLHLETYSDRWLGADRAIMALDLTGWKVER